MLDRANGCLNWACRVSLEVHGVFIPEMAIDLAAEAARLRAVMDKVDCVNIFVSEGAGVEAIVAEMQAKGQEVPRDAFGHVKLDAVNPGKWFGEQFAQMIGAEKTLIQKSGYFARAAAANVEDMRLIKSCADLAVECAFRRESGVMGHDEDRAAFCARLNSLASKAANLSISIPPGSTKPLLKSVRLRAPRLRWATKLFEQFVG